MLLTPHVLSGMMFGGFANDYRLSPFLGLISYFIVELIPHWDPENKDSKTVLWIRFLDIILAFVTFFGVIMFMQIDPDRRNMVPQYLLGGIGGSLPYLFFFAAMWNHHISDTLLKAHTFKSKIKFRDRSGWGILIQVAICILCIAIIFKLLPFPSWNKFVQQFL